MATQQQTTLTFTTPVKKPATEQPVQVELCGETMTLFKPKDAVLYFARVVGADTASDPDRVMAAVQFIEGCFPPEGRKRFYDRVLTRDDPVDVDQVFAMVEGLLERWGAESADPEAPVVVPTPASVAAQHPPVRVVHKKLGIDMQAHNPKVFVMLLAATSLAARADEGQQAWAMGMFLDAALSPEDGLEMERRMRDRQDSLDLEHVADIVGGLVQQWRPDENRQQRRQNSRSRTVASR